MQSVLCAHQTIQLSSIILVCDECTLEGVRVAFSGVRLAYTTYDHISCIQEHLRAGFDLTFEISVGGAVSHLLFFPKNHLNGTQFAAVIPETVFYYVDIDTAVYVGLAGFCYSFQLESNKFWARSVFVWFKIL